MKRVSCATAVVLCSALVSGIARAQALDDSVRSSPPDSSRVIIEAPGPPARPWHQVRIVPDLAAVFDLQSRLATRSRVRLSGDFGQMDLSDVRVTSEGVGGTRASWGTHGRAADTVATISWPDIRSMEVGTRGWQKGAQVGTMVGATPGLVLISGAFDVSTPPTLSAFMLFIGVPLAAAGAVGGCAVGALVGGGIVSWQTIYSAPVVSILANPANLPVRSIAVGQILENGKRARNPTGVTTTVASRSRAGASG